MIILFPIEQFDRDKLREMTDDELVALADKHPEGIPTYDQTEDYLTDVDDQTVDTDRYWHCHVRKVYVVSYTIIDKQFRVVCKTPEEAKLFANRLGQVPDLTVTECYDGSPLTLPDPDTKVTSLTSYMRPRQLTMADIPYDIFSVTFIYDTPMGKTRCVVECKTNEEAMKIAHDASSVDGIKYVRTYPCKRPAGKDGVRMTAKDYWKMYGNK